MMGARLRFDAKLLVLANHRTAEWENVRTPQRFDIYIQGKAIGPWFPIVAFRQENPLRVNVYRVLKGPHRRLMFGAYTVGLTQPCEFAVCSPSIFTLQESKMAGKSPIQIVQFDDLPIYIYIHMDADFQMIFPVSIGFPLPAMLEALVALVIKLLQFFGAVCVICTLLPHGSPPGCGQATVIPSTNGDFFSQQGWYMG